MRDVRVALAQIAPRLGNLESNLSIHEEAVAEARGQKAGVVVFPELSLTGYVLRDQVPEVAIGVDSALMDRLKQLSRSLDVVVGLVEESPGHRFHNAAVYLSGGELVHLHRKVYLPTYGMFQEGRDFAAGERLRRFDAPYGPAGLLVCEDLWHPTSSWLLAHEGAEVIFTLSSGPTRGAKPEQEVTSVAVWRRLLRVSAQFQTSFMVYVNRVGCEEGLTFGGGSAVVDPFGRVLAELPPLDEGVCTVDLDGEVLRRARTAYPLLRDANPELVARELERIRRVRYDLPAEESDSGSTAPGRLKGRKR